MSLDDERVEEELREMHRRNANASIELGLILTRFSSELSEELSAALVSLGSVLHGGKSGNLPNPYMSWEGEMVFPKATVSKK